MANYFDQFDPAPNFFDQFDPKPGAPKQDRSYLGASVEAGGRALLAAGARIIDELNPFTLSESDAATLFKDNPDKLKELTEKSAAMVLSRFANEQTTRAREAMQAVNPAETGLVSGKPLSELEYATLDPEKAAYLSPTRVAGDVLNSLPTTLALAVTGYLTKGASTRAGAQAEAAAVARGASQAEAQAAARAAAIEAGANTMAKVGAASEGAAGYGMQRNQTFDEAMRTPEEKLAESPAYQGLLEQGYSPQAARLKLSSGVAQEAGLIAGAVDAGTNLVGGQILGRVIGEGGKLLPRAAKGFVTEAATETVQSAGEQLGENLAMRAIDPALELTKGVGEAAAAGLVVGGVTGGATTALFGSRQRQADGERKLREAPDAATAAAAANELAGSVDELTSSVDAYLNRTAPGGVPPAGPSGPAGRPTLQQLQQRIDRETELREQAQNAGTDFERRMALEQIQATRPDAPPRQASSFVELQPMSELQATQRLAILRDELAQSGGNALGLEVVPHPSVPNRFAIAERALPSLDLTSPAAAPVTQAEATTRLQAAQQAGQSDVRRGFFQPYEAVTDQLQRGIEANQGAIPAPGAAILDSAQVGIPANQTGGQGLRAYDSVTGTTDTGTLEVPTTPALRNAEEKRVAENQATNDQSMAEQQARSVANQQQSARELQAQIEQTSQPAAAPSTADVIDAIKTPGPQRTAEQVLALRQARSRYSAADFSLLERAATAPFGLNNQERSRLRELAQPTVAPEQQFTPETPPLMGERVARALGLPSNGIVVTSNAKLSTNRQGPGGTLTVNDNGEQHTATVVDPGKLGNSGRLLQQIARIFGKRLVVFQSDTLKADGFVLDGNNRDIHINANAQMSPLAVFGHELMHLLKRDHPQAYAAVEAVLKQQLTPEQMAAFEADYGKGANLEELASDLLGNRFQEPEFWTAVFDQIASQNPTGAAGIIARVGAALNRAITSFLNAVSQSKFKADEIVGDVTAVRAALQTALADYAKQQRNPAIAMEATTGATQSTTGATQSTTGATQSTTGATQSTPLQAEGNRLREVARRARQEMGETITASPQRGQEPPAEGRVGKVDTHVLNAVRGARALGDKTKVDAGEKAIIRKAAALMKLPITEVEQMVRDHKAAHPAQAGWAQLKLTGAKVNEDTGKGELQYQTIPYTFNAGPNGSALTPGSAGYAAKVANLGQAMLREVRAVFDRAQTGEQAAKNIIAQSGWYKEMRTRLRQEFGGLGDLFADLLGATSPNTPVRTNWDNSVEALRLATTGAFDALLPKWVAYFDNLDNAETAFRAFYDEMLESGMTKAAIQRMPEYAWWKERMREARDFPDDLLPVKSNGKKFGFNGFNVARAMVDLWRVVKNSDPDIGRGGTAPKAINFSGNLIGFRSRATIDVWAARMLQRLAGGLRIPSMAEGGVSGEALENGRNTLQFGFGQDVFSKAVSMIRNDPVLSQDPVLRSINDDDLQALVWFIEKEVWTKGNWTSAAGEGGSFEFESDLAGVSDRERVNELRKTADSSVSASAEQRAQAEADIERVMGEMAALPAIAAADQVLADNAKRVQEDKTAPKPLKLTKAEKAEIVRQNEQARADKKKAKASKAYKALESELNRAKAVLKKPTTEERQQMRAGAVRELGQIARPVDRFTVGLSIQKGAEQGMAPTPPSDAQMALLAERVAESVVAGDPGATVIGLKSIATEGRYGAPERALDLEAIVRDSFDARPLARTTFEVAQEADQDAAFVARVLRPNERFDPQMHRPGVEIYFRDMNQAAEAARMMAEIAGMRVVKATEMGPGYFEVGGYTVIVDGRPTAEAKRGEMGKPVGMRVLYMPEFEARYGIDARLENATDEQLAAIIEDRADTLGDFADAVLRQFDGVSFAGRFNYEVETRFAGEYQGAIDAYSSRAAGERAGAGQGQAWRGRTVRESVAAATGRLSVDAGQPGTELPGGDRAGAEQGRVGPASLSRRRNADEVPRDELAGRTLKIEVRVQDTGDTAVLTMDAKDALDDVDERESVMNRLLECLG